MQKKQQQAVSTSGVIEKAELVLCWREHQIRTGFSRTAIRDFPGGPVVKTPPSNAQGVGSIPGWGTKIP